MSATTTETYDQAHAGDPTVRGPEECGDCPGEHMVRVSRGQPPVPVFCTRDAGHAGQHVAEGTRSVLAVWQD